MKEDNAALNIGPPDILNAFLSIFALFCKIKKHDICVH